MNRDYFAWVSHIDYDLLNKYTKRRLSRNHQRKSKRRLAPKIALRPPIAGVAPYIDIIFEKSE